MLTSSANQYLRPEYLSPLPTTLDSKKSPLALLAQTCSNIGVDNKPLNLDKSKDHHGHNQHNSQNNHNSDRKKSGSSSSVNSSSSSSSVAADDNSNCGSVSASTTSNNVKLSFKPYDNLVTSKKVSTSNYNNDNIVERNCDNNNSAGDVIVSDKPSQNRKTESSSPKCNGNSSPIGSGKNTPAKETRKTPSSSSSSTTTSNSIISHSSASTTSSSSSVSSALSYTSLGLPDMMLNGHNKDAISSLSSLAAFKNSNPMAGNCCPTPHGVGPLSHHHLNVDKTGAYPSIYPSLSYARMKAGNGQSLIPMCRDPFCGGSCQLSAMQNATLLAAAAASCTPGTCPNGCNQCDHQRLMSSLALTHPGLVPGLSQGYGSSYYSPLNSGLPSRPSNVCNWIVGDTHCGKRFPTSEELLQHLRTHTSPASDPTSVSLMSQIGSSLGAGCHMSHYTTAGTVPPPSLTTAAGLRRTYPTSFSPLSNRFHPYKPPTIPSLGGMPPVPGASPVPPSMASLHSSALSMYYSPYGIYGGRLGPSVHH